MLARDTNFENKMSDQTVSHGRIKLSVTNKDPKLQQNTNTPSFCFYQRQKSFTMKAMLVFAVALLVMTVAWAEDSDSEKTIDLSRSRIVSPRLLRRGAGVRLRHDVFITGP